MTPSPSYHFRQLSKPLPVPNSILIFFRNIVDHVHFCLTPRQALSHVLPDMLPSTWQGTA